MHLRGPVRWPRCPERYTETVSGQSEAAARNTERGRSSTHARRRGRGWVDVCCHLRSYESHARTSGRGRGPYVIVTERLPACMLELYSRHARLFLFLFHFLEKRQAFLLRRRLSLEHVALHRGQPLCDRVVVVLHPAPLGRASAAHDIPRSDSRRPHSTAFSPRNTYGAAEE